MKRYFLLLLFFSAVLMGPHAANEPFGCGCGGEDDDHEIPGGGAIAASATYALDRAELGTTFSNTTAPATGNQVSATLGLFLSQGKTESASYRIHHPMTRKLAKDKSSLTIEDQD